MKPNTIAKSLAIGNPADGYYASGFIQKSGGWAEDVTDEEICGRHPAAGGNRRHLHGNRRRRDRRRDEEADRTRARSIAAASRSSQSRATG